MEPKKVKRLSFNQWLATQTAESPHFSLASVWKTARGRLTRDSVAIRADALGLHERVGFDAWDAYVLAFPALAAAPTDSPSTSDGTNNKETT